MARGIPSTPVLNAEDSRALLKSLERHCGPVEKARRLRAAKRRLAEAAAGTLRIAGRPRGPHSYPWVWYAIIVTAVWIGGFLFLLRKR